MAARSQARNAFRQALQPDRLHPPVQTLDSEDIPPVLAPYWQQPGLPDNDVGRDGQAVGTIVGITGGNFRLIELLMTQVDRLVDISDFDDIGQTSPPPDRP